MGTSPLKTTLFPVTESSEKGENHKTLISLDYLFKSQPWKWHNINTDSYYICIVKKSIKVRQHICREAWHSRNTYPSIIMKNITIYHMFHQTSSSSRLTICCDINTQSARAPSKVLSSHLITHMNLIIPTEITLNLVADVIDLLETVPFYIYIYIYQATATYLSNTLCFL